MKVSRPIVYTIVFAVAAYAVFLVTEPETKARRAMPRLSPASQTPAVEGFLKEDFEKRFAPVTLSGRDTFKPLVGRGAARMVTSIPGGIPPAFAGGDGDWAFTGVAEVDGSRMALLENFRTSEGVFVKVGETFKGSKVTSLTSETMVLVSPDGEAKPIKIGDGTRPEASPEGTTNPAGNPPGSVAPLQPPLRGMIGGNLSVVPDGTTTEGSTRQGRNRAR